MKNRRSLPPILPLALAWLGFAIYVWSTAEQLPERVATHFAGRGEPNAWQPQADYVRFILICGATVPAMVLATSSLIQLGNGWGLNIPHKDYWLAAERRGQTFAFVRRQCSALALLLIAFLAGVHYLILVANARSPVSLPSTLVLQICGAFLAATLVWSVIFLTHFFRKPA